MTGYFPRAEKNRRGGRVSRAAKPKKVRRRWRPGRSPARSRPAPAVRADAGKIRQVVLNLMLNALDAMPSGGRVTLAAEAAPGGRVRFSVSDTGGGVQVAVGTDIFEPFVSGKQGGTGLGLYVCRRIVRQHEGEIGYRTSPEGSTFWFELPGDKS